MVFLVVQFLELLTLDRKFPGILRIKGPSEDPEADMLQAEA